MNRIRCRWCNKKNPLYVAYHDEEWGRPQYDDAMLYELLVLEPFQTGLSWEIILNKRENFRAAFDSFNPLKISRYDEHKIQALMADSGIIRNRSKIEATISNAAVFLQIQAQWGSFRDYIWHFTARRVIYETDVTHSALSDLISSDLKKRGMKFMGTTVVYSYLQAIGVIYSHDRECYLFHDVSIS